MFLSPLRGLLIKSAMTARGGSVIRCSVVSHLYAVCGNAKDWPGRVRWPGRHGGEAPAMCVGTDDVGLDPLVLSCQEERTEINMPQPQMPAIAQANVGMTWLLYPPAP